MYYFFPESKKKKKLWYSFNSLESNVFNKGSLSNLGFEVGSPFLKIGL